MFSSLNPLCNYLYAPIQLPINNSPPQPTGTKRKHDDVSRVVLSRENTLKYSSADYETYINDITSVEPLTPSEQREMKKTKKIN